MSSIRAKLSLFYMISSGQSIAITANTVVNPFSSSVASGKDDDAMAAKLPKRFRRTLV